MDGWMDFHYCSYVRLYVTLIKKKQPFFAISWLTLKKPGMSTTEGKDEEYETIPSLRWLMDNMRSQANKMESLKH